MIDPNAARSMGISRREQALARQISQQLPNLFSRRKLTPLFSSIDLTRLANFSILLASMDTRKIGDHGPYTHPELLHQLSDTIGARRTSSRSSSLCGPMYSFRLASYQFRRSAL